MRYGISTHSFYIFYENLKHHQVSLFKWILCTHILLISILITYFPVDYIYSPTSTSTLKIPWKNKTCERYICHCKRKLSLGCLIYVQTSIFWRLNQISTLNYDVPLLKLHDGSSVDEDLSSDASTKTVELTIL